MRVWRITRHSEQVLTGEDARLVRGRWNSEGIPIVYTASTLALAALEYLAHVKGEELPQGLVALEVELPDDVPTGVVDLADLPVDWNLIPCHPACVAIGDRWVAECRALLLRVPSAIIPEESNYLLNPRHPDAPRARVVTMRDFTFDARLL